MKFVVKHEGKGRIRVHFLRYRMTYREADTLQYYLETLPFVEKAKVYEQTVDAVVCYSGDRQQVIEAFQQFSYENVEVPEAVLQNSGRELNATYREKLITKVLLRAAKRLLVPMPARYAMTGMKAARYMHKGFKTLMQRKIEVPVLDATAIGVSLLRGDCQTAGSIMFLLEIGELLEEWTHKKSVGDLARSMSLQVGKVWMVSADKQEILVPINQVRPGDLVKVRMGTMIPFDGEVQSGEAMVNQASLTGESLAVRKCEGSTVYAGTVLEEGELTIAVRETVGCSRYEKIVTMIEESEKLKSGLESKAEHLADKLVPYSLVGTALTYLLTRNATKALAILMVDYSCALKLAMPIAVLSAIREAGNYGITVKGGKYLEAIAEAETIVFDKTGTLTKACPVVAEVVPFCEQSSDELLRIAACMEEHFPHSVARAVVEAAKSRNLIHEEMHTKVEYIVAHGISTTIEGRKAVIGSYHFVMEDEGCYIPEEYKERFKQLSPEYSHLYLALEGRLAAVICIDDPLREEAVGIVKALKETGIKKVVMMTGDSKRVAATIARKVGVDEYYSEVLPEDKAGFVEREKALGKKVIMIGDGINDSLALSCADVGVAISDGAEIAREVADVTIAAENLNELVTLKKLSNELMKRIRKNYRAIVGYNSSLIVLGVAGALPPTTSALLHNTSTLTISLKSMGNLLESDRKY